MLLHSAAKPLYVASSNRGKLREFRDIANESGLFVEPLPNPAGIPAPAETGDTFEENARIKAIAYSRALPGELVFADDSGLEVDALGGAPGVHSARYAATDEQPAPSDSDNNYKLLYELSKLGDVPRSARFVCVLALARDGEVLATFQADVAGEILAAPLGHGGFGYDPLFYVPELGNTLAEIEPEEKSKISHRGKSFRSMVAWVLGQQTPVSSS